MVATLAEAALLIRADMSRVQGEIASGTKRAASQAGQASGTAFGEKFTGTVKGFSGRAAGAIGTLTTAVTGVGLAGLVTFGLKSAASLEQAQIGFETLLKSGKRARLFLGDLQKFAAATPFELPGLIDASRTLLGVGVSSKQVIPLLKAFGDTAGAVGIKQDAFQRIMIATSQSISAGRFNLGDLNQIMTNGIPIYTILSKALGKPVVEIRKMSTAGKLLSKDVLPALQKEMEKDYGGAMARQSMTLAGVWSTLTDTVSIGLANALKPLVPMLSDFIPKAASAASAGLAAASKGIVALVSGFQGKAPAIGGFVGALQRLGLIAHNAWPEIQHIATVAGGALLAAFRAVQPIVTSLVGWFNQHRTVVASLAVAMGALVVVTRAHAAVLAVEAAGGLIKYISGIRIVSALTKVWAAVQWVLDAALAANPIGIVVIALAALVGGLVLAWRNSSTFRDIVIGAWNGIKAAAGAVAGWFMTYVWPTLRTVFNGIAWAVKAGLAAAQLVTAVFVAYYRNVVAPIFTWLWRNIVSPAFNAIRNVITTTWNIVKVPLSALGNFIKVTLVGAFRSGVAAISTAWNLLKAAAKTPISFVVNHVINPLIGGFNKVAKVFGTSQISPIGGFASGGRIPGMPSSRDNVLGSMVSGGGKYLGPVKVATGEFIVNARDTAKALPLLQWINAGMKGGPAAITRKLGRKLTDMPGDGSEGWAFAAGGLVGFLSDVWGAISNPGKLISGPLNALIAKIPGGGLLHDLLGGMGHKLVSGLLGWINGTGGAMGGNVGKARAFVQAQNGKPYVWASAGPGGYDCSGIVSAAYNVLKGKNPYSHTFSTESLPGHWFHQGMRTGALIAGWSHPGQAPASASVGHMAGMIGGLPFESSGSRGVHMGASARGVGQFANIGAAYAHGGLAQIAMADTGRVTLQNGWNLVGNGTGRPEPLSATGGRMHPDDISALASAISDALAHALMGTVPATRVAARQAGRRIA